MDVYFEYLVKRKNNSQTQLYRILVICASVFLFILLVDLGIKFPLFLLLFLLLAVLSIYGARFILGYFNLEFEYIITNGDMDVDKVIAKKKRKRLLTVNFRNIEIMAPVNGAHKKEFNEMPYQKKIDASISEDEKNTYFIIGHSEKHGIVKLIFSPDERIIKAAKTFAPHKVFTD